MFWVSGLIFWVSELILRVSGRAGGRPGRVTETFGERINFGNMYSEKTEYCMYHYTLLLEYFYKKDARQTMLHFRGGIALRSLT